MLSQKINNKRWRDMNTTYFATGVADGAGVGVAAGAGVAGVATDGGREGVALPLA